MHVLTKISALCCLTLCVNVLPAAILFALALSLCLWSVVFYPATLLRVLKRVRWLLLVLFVVYAYATPGQYLKDWFMSFRPSYEGLELAVLQVVKMLTVLAGLVILLATSTMATLISGLYQAARCFECLGVDAKQFAVRLGLTLQYVEHQTSSGFAQTAVVDLFRQITQVKYTDYQPVNMQISLQPLQKKDIAFICLCCFITCYCLWEVMF